MVWVLPYQLLIKRMHYTFAQKPTWWWHFLKRSFLFQNDSTLYLVNTKLASKEINGHFPNDEIEMSTTFVRPSRPCFKSVGEREASYLPSLSYLCDTLLICIPIRDLFNPQLTPTIVNTRMYTHTHHIYTHSQVFKLFYFMYLGVLSAFMSLHPMCTVTREMKRGSSIHWNLSYRWL